MKTAINKSYPKNFFRPKGQRETIYPPTPAPSGLPIGLVIIHPHADATHTHPYLYS